MAADATKVVDGSNVELGTESGAGFRIPEFGVVPGCDGTNSLALAVNEETTAGCRQHTGTICNHTHAHL